MARIIYPFKKILISPNLGHCHSHCREKVSGLLETVGSRGSAVETSISSPRDGQGRKTEGEERKTAAIDPPGTLNVRCPQIERESPFWRASGNEEIEVWEED